MPEKLKKGWSRVAFGDVVRLCRERSSDPARDGIERYVGLEHLEPGDLKLRRWGNVSDGTTFTSVFRAGQVLFGKRRAYQRKVAVADFDGVCSGDIYVLEPKNEHLLPELLPFICQTDGFFEHAVGTSAGSLSPRTNWDSLASYEFPLPPLEEQRRIVDVLGVEEQVLKSWYDTIKHFDKLYLNLSRTLFRHKALPKAIQRNGCTWRTCTFADAATLQRGHDLPISDREFGDFPVFGANGICGSHSKAMYQGPGVLTGRSGTIGEVYYVEKPYWPLNTTLFVKDFHGNNPKFIYHLLKSLDCRKFSAGSAIPTLNRNDVHPTIVQIPDLPDQLRIVKKLDELEKCGESVRQHCRKITEIMKSLLKRFWETEAK